MSRFQLADVSQAVALQHEKKLVLYVEGTTTGYGGSFYIFRSPTRIYPPAFFVYEIPGNPGTPGPQVETVTKAAVAFDGAYGRLSLHGASGRMDLRAVTVADYAPDASGLGASALGAPTADGGEKDDETDWTAYHNFQPGSKPRLTVRGKVFVPSSGYTATLIEHVPQGFNPAILLLDLKLTPPSGIVTPAFEWIEVEFAKQTSAFYTDVQVLPDGPSIPVHRVY